MGKYTDLLKEFWAYWHKRVAKGYSSSFNRCEVLSIELFAEWLDKRERKKVKKEVANE